MSWILETLKGLVAAKYLGSIIRTGLAGLGGFLLAIGVSPDDVEKFTSSGNTVALALASYALAQLWSWLEKSKK